jgi:hypothetical protein
MKQLHRILLGATQADDHPLANPSRGIHTPAREALTSVNRHLMPVTLAAHAAECNGQMAWRLCLFRKDRHPALGKCPW